MNAGEINQRLNDATAAKITMYPCNNLRASNLGHPCERYLYLLISQWQEQTPHDLGLQYIFDLGNALEPHVINKIKEAGYEVFTPVRRSWKIDNPLITGREDIRIKDENGELFPVEIKGLSPTEFDKLNTVEDFYRSRRHYVRGYPAQLLVYEYYFEKEKGYFALLNKLTGRIKLIEVPFDWDAADALIKKAERIYKALETTEPPEACDDISVCENCNLQHLCTAKHTRPETLIDSGELESLILERESLRPSERRFREVQDEINRIAYDYGHVVTDSFVVTVRDVTRKGYTVEEKQYKQVSVKRL